jgi:hypothetical protein
MVLGMLQLILLMVLANHKGRSYRSDKGISRKGEQYQVPKQSNDNNGAEKGGCDQNWRL